MESSQNIPLLRLVITGFVLTLGIVLALQVGHRISTHGTLAQTAPLPAGPPHELTVYAIEDVRLDVTADGQPVYAKRPGGTQSVSFVPLTRSELTSPTSAGFASHTTTSASSHSAA